jgi:hypothetical protein
MLWFLVEVGYLFERKTGHIHRSVHITWFPSCPVCTAGLPTADLSVLWTRPKLPRDADGEGFACFLQPGLLPVRHPILGTVGESGTRESGVGIGVGLQEHPSSDRRGVPGKQTANLAGVSWSRQETLLPFWYRQKAQSITILEDLVPGSEVVQVQARGFNLRYEIISPVPSQLYSIGRGEGQVGRVLKCLCT